MRGKASCCRNKPSHVKKSRGPAGHDVQSEDAQSIKESVSHRSSGRSAMTDNIIFSWILIGRRRRFVLLVDWAMGEDDSSVCVCICVEW